MGLPAVSLPTGLDSAGQPYGLQLVGRARQDAALLQVAAWVERRVTAPPLPAAPR
ncbi:MAG: hypothetical protein NZ518_00595 [Dehalococcoidia bacterium]|nr:hypothetical protein [Dehalococcoidia bacterium]